MKITIASGKGGTGKTTLAVNLATALGNNNHKVSLLDCDVEEPNDHLFVKPEFTKKTKVTVKRPVWNSDTCTFCGKCAESCVYNAIAVVKKKVLIFNELCHACGVCSEICPTNALIEEDSPIGIVEQDESHTPFKFAHGILNVGEPLAPTIVKAVKKETESWEGDFIIDSAPGTGCPVVEALENTDVAVLVTEPTPFGLNDLKLATQLCLNMKIPTGIVINRSGKTDSIIETWANKANIPVIGKIPFNRKYAESYSKGNILSDDFSEFNTNLLNIYKNIKELSTQKAPEMFETRKSSVKLSSSPKLTDSSPNMKEFVVISGKGGTGKTTVTGAFAILSNNTAVFSDNDVDAADLHLLLDPAIKSRHEFTSGKKAVINKNSCISCGKCFEACHFDAIRFDGPSNSDFKKTYKVNSSGCEGCTLCTYVCPTNAITMETQVTGEWFISNSNCGPMAHAELGVGEENSGKLVTQVRNASSSLSGKFSKNLIIADGPPGTSCPVIASVSGTDLIIIVTEPTVSGVHDLTRVLRLAKQFNVTAKIIINKADINSEQCERIKEAALKNNADIIGEIPFDPSVGDALSCGKTIVEYNNGPASKAIYNAWKTIKRKFL